MFLELRDSKCHFRHRVNRTDLHSHSSKAFPMTSWSPQCPSPAPVDKEDKDGRCGESNFPPLSMRKIPWPPVRLFCLLIRLLHFKAETTAAMQSYPGTSGSCAAVGLMSRRVSPRAYSVNNNNGNLFHSNYRSWMCSDKGPSGAPGSFSYYFYSPSPSLALFPPLINKQHFRDSPMPKFTKSAHLQCSCSECVWPSLACPFSHNARHPLDNGMPPPILLLLPVLPTHLRNLSLSTLLCSV